MNSHRGCRWLPPTRDNCLGAEYPPFRACPVNLTRREAMAADVVMVNDHHFFADLVVRERGMAEPLPTVRVFVFDEAHQLTEIGVQFIGLQLSTGQLEEVARDMLSTGWRLARGVADWQGLADGLLAAARLLQGCADRCTAMSGNLSWELASQDEFGFKDAVELLVRVSNETLAALDSVGMMSPEFPRLRERLLEIGRLAEGVRSTSPEPGSVRRVEVGVAVHLVQAPLDIAATVRSRLPTAPVESPGGRTWMFTSGTLGAEASLRLFTEHCGLTEASVLRVPSAF